MSSSLRRVLALSLAALAATVTSCSSSAGPGTSTPSPTSSPAAQSNYPFTIENCGRTYTYTQAPARVLVGWPKTVETLTALGVGSTVTGYISSKFGPPPQGITTSALSTDYSPAAETILSAKPDFFLANGDSQLKGSRGGVTPDDLSQIGANIYVMGNDCNDTKGGTTVDTVYQDITNLGRIFNVPDKAAALNGTLRARVAAAAGLRGSAPPPKIAYVQVFEDKLIALSGLSYNAQIEGVGGVNILADPNRRFGEISAEKVLTFDADAIVFAYNIELETIDEQKSQIVKVLGDSRAVRDGKIVGVPAYLAEGPGVAVVEAIELIAKTIYG